MQKQPVYNLLQTGYINQQNCIAKALKDKILFTLENEFELYIKKCRGQCYDGAGNMVLKYSSSASRKKEINDLALYTHCASHRLNLCVGET